VITVGQRFCAQAGPELGLIKFLSHLNGNVEVATLNSKIESSGGVLNELKSDLRVTLLLKIRNDRLADQARVSNNMKHLFIIALDECQLKSVFRGVNLKDTRLGGSVKAVNVTTLNLDQVDSLVKSSNNAVIAIKQSVLDMVKSGIKQNASIVPSSALDANSLVQGANLLEGL
jgi:hypothetical protein